MLFLNHCTRIKEDKPRLGEIKKKKQKLLFSSKFKYPKPWYNIYKFNALIQQIQFNNNHIEICDC